MDRAQSAIQGQGGERRKEPSKQKWKANSLNKKIRREDAPSNVLGMSKRESGIHRPDKKTLHEWGKL